MKKLLLSIIVIGVFAVYSAYARKESAAPVSELPVVLSPAPTDTSQPQVSDTQTQQPPSGPSPTTVPISPTAIPQTSTKGRYKDGTYTGSVADAFYGNIQVQAIIQGGAISDVQFLQYPNDRETSVSINSQAMPILKSEAIQAQSANVDIVSGATDSSQAFRESLSAALQQANP